MSKQNRYMQNRYIIWRRVFGSVPFDGYMTSEKGHIFGSKQNAHLFTQKQAIRIVHSYNDYAQNHYEVWGYTII